MLTPLQQRIARVVFASTPDPQLALAGGAALISLGLVDRATIDLDFFTTTPDVHEIVDAITRALGQEGLTVRTELDAATFVRLVVRAGVEECQVDVAQDFRVAPAASGSLGPTLTPEELAADKVLTLFARAEARDYIDVYFLAQRLGKDRLLALAREKDFGFGEDAFAPMLGAIDRLDREEFTVDEVTFAELRAFFAAWRKELQGR